MLFHSFPALCLLLILPASLSSPHRALEGVPLEGYDHCSVDPSAHLWVKEGEVTVLTHNDSGPVVVTGPYGNFTDGYKCVPGDSEKDVYCTASGERYSLCSRSGGFMCNARVRRSSLATGAELGSTFVDVCVPGDCVGSVAGPPSCYYKGKNCPKVSQRQSLTIKRMCKNPNEICDVTYLCVGKTGPCSASTYHKFEMTEMSGCECPGCPKAVVQGGPAVDDSQNQALSMLSQFMERNDFTCLKPTQYKQACADVDGYMCTVRVDAKIKNIVTELVSTRGGTVDMCMWGKCAHCYNRLPWENYFGCGESLSSLHYMANDNQHIKNALIEMFGNEQMSEATITSLEYRCKMKPFVDVGAIAGGSSSGIGGLFIFFVLILFFIKRKIRDEKRAVMLLGKSEEEKNKLLDEWGIGYQAKRQKEIQKAMKKHKKEELHKKKLKLKAQKRIAKRKKELEKRIEKVNANHDKKRFSTNFSSARERRNEAKRKTERKKRLEALGVTQAEIDRVEQQEHPELAALEMEDVAIKRIEDSFGNIEASDVRSEEFLGRGGGIFGEGQSAAEKSKFGGDMGIQLTAMKQIKEEDQKKEDDDETKGLLDGNNGSSSDASEESADSDNDKKKKNKSSDSASGSGSGSSSSDEE